MPNTRLHANLERLTQRLRAVQSLGLPKSLKSGVASWTGKPKALAGSGLALFATPFKLLRITPQAYLLALCASLSLLLVCKGHQWRRALNLIGARLVQGLLLLLKKPLKK